MTNHLDKVAANLTRQIIESKRPIPSQFAIKCLNPSDPLWRKYINFINENYLTPPEHLAGELVGQYCGVSANGVMSSYDLSSFASGTVLLTIEEWSNIFKQDIEIYYNKSGERVEVLYYNGSNKRQIQEWSENAFVINTNGDLVTDFIEPNEKGEKTLLWAEIANDKYIIKTDKYIHQHRRVYLILYEEIFRQEYFKENPLLSLPRVYAIKCLNPTSKLWKEYISSHRFSSRMTFEIGIYYGINDKGFPDYFEEIEDFGEGVVELTLEQWAELIKPAIPKNLFFDFKNSNIKNHSLGQLYLDNIILDKTDAHEVFTVEDHQTRQKCQTIRIEYAYEAVRKERQALLKILDYLRESFE